MQCLYCGEEITGGVIKYRMSRSLKFYFHLHRPIYYDGKFVCYQNCYREWRSRYISL